jgi:pSer/pThr/pTyr-binding forkhead associated (FHA) protein
MSAQTGSEDPLARHSLGPAELQALLAAERDGGPFLAFRDGDGTLGIFPLSERASAHIGRRPDMDLAVSWDAEVSGLHAELTSLSGEWTVLDDGLSTNGTFVNEQRVAGRVRLRDGDRVRVGRTVLAFRAQRAGLVQETVAAANVPKVDVTEAQRRVLLALCRPLANGGEAVPATNQEIADEVFLSVDAVKMHLRALFARFGLEDLPQNRKRATLAARALQSGVVSQRELEARSLG